MKKIIYTVFALGLLAIAKPAAAQVNVNINIGSQPMWGPTGYDYARYYYMPEMNVYYDVVQRRYTYPRGNRWVTVRTLPASYRHVDMYRTYKVVLNQAHPWKNHRAVRKQYARYANNHSQRVLRDHRGHDRYEKKHHHKKGKHRDHRRRSHRD
ncbi:hypothetical protein PQ465_09710 [Sphingobacterium oryzagri]|uniref:Uncharacterized protein n=1 Tax=Sphingobacterium oryzagri TaxID=3025669 RepID=A0ABY7WQB8_9SPHI|nr:hypothetical protein [Sphingobacterium sp. KACC 22765]WDF70633.1 hypothetical protein PQ465_09710 [Sphingobacterium sp. KACC 22765]